MKQTYYKVRQKCNVFDTFGTAKIYNFSKSKEKINIYTIYITFWLLAICTKQTFLLNSKTFHIIRK